MLGYSRIVDPRRRIGNQERGVTGMAYLEFVTLGLILGTPHQIEAIQTNSTGGHKCGESGVQRSFG